MKANRTRHADIPAYVTKDGSEIRELMHPAGHGVERQSLAEATVPIAGRTLMHLHRQTEEIYHFVSGRGRMWLGDEVFAVAQGDTVVIAPGIAHRVENTGRGPLRILCACAPAYSHEDTVLLEPAPGP